jgi:hypothetical protein
MPVISALRKVRQDDLKFQASLGYIARHCLKTEKRRKGRERKGRGGKGKGKQKEFPEEHVAGLPGKP